MIGHRFSWGTAFRYFSHCSILNKFVVVAHLSKPQDDKNLSSLSRELTHVNTLAIKCVSIATTEFVQSGRTRARRPLKSSTPNRTVWQIVLFMISAANCQRNKEFVNSMFICFVQIALRAGEWPWYSSSLTYRLMIWCTRSVKYKYVHSRVAYIHQQPNRVMLILLALFPIPSSLSLSLSHYQLCDES